MSNDTFIGFASAKQPLPKMRKSSSMEGALRASGGLEIIEKIDRVMESHPDEHMHKLQQSMKEVR